MTVLSELLTRYKRTIADRRGALSHDADCARPILQDLLGEIPLQPAGDEIHAEFETRPERIFLSGQATSNFWLRGPAT
jgi:hypothetical protein